MSPQHQKKSGGDRKHGRNKIKCGVYRMLRKKERSHVRRIERHMRIYKDDSPMVVEALDRYRRAIVTK